VLLKVINGVVCVLVDRFEIKEFGTSKAEKTLG